MTLKFSVTKRQYVDFNVYHFQHSKQAKRGVRIVQLVPGIVFLLLFAYLGYIRGGQTAVLFYGMGVLIAALWMVFIPKYYARSLRRNATKMVDEGRGNDFLGPQQLTLGEERMEWVSNTTSSYAAYSAIERIGAGYGCYFIYIGAIKAFIVPFSAFEDKAQEKRFLELLFQKSGVACSA